MILEQTDRKKQLQEAWRTNEVHLHTLNPYRHLQHYDPQNQQTSRTMPTAMQLDDHTALYRQAKQLRSSEAS